MDRIVKIAIYLAVLFFLSIWISSVFKSCSSPSTDIADSEVIDESNEFEEDFFEDDLTAGDEESYTSDMGGGTVESDFEPDDFASEYTEVDEALEENATSAPKPLPSNTRTTGGSTGKYMVLTGSYLVKDNANNMVRKLDKLGYDNAEIVVFNMSQYHSVCAARFWDYNAATQLSNELKRRGVDNYVHTKQ